LVDLSVNIGQLKLKNPVMAASGTFGPEYRELIDINSLGAIILKTVTLNERSGNPPPRVAETESGMLNSIGLENKGFADFAKNKISKLRGIKIPVIASIAGDNEKEYGMLAAKMDRLGPKIDAIEINLSCPNVRHGRREGLIAQDEAATRQVLRAARRSTRLPLIAKLAPNVTNITNIAVAAAKGGADAVLVSNTFQAMAVDIETRMPKLGNITGGLSGPAIKPVVLKMVWDLYNSIDLPIIGCGGIMDYKDAAEFMICGASAIQVGTATFANPRAATDIVKSLKGYMTKNGYKKLNEFTGKLKTGAL